MDIKFGLAKNLAKSEEFIASHGNCLQVLRI
ncbi:hypothetical protein SVI_3720 [Shewanella violacea DSS12]|uniref:Uncharacterized protein n=1 Tax=Shewanella violacea (strain JCM 10179 / CIP 106290 / LMG 19151 / DSS12) TaxID=637905 RepID=D4ZCE6_SHEVD|nr:hypothetical protein SVI_3720 [Shewanella violacea DSS12]